MELDHSTCAIPISLLTGFLGSGKTTVLNHLLHHPDLSRTAVVINEFGEIGLDHELVESSTENMVLLQSGCLCCTIRGDLVQTLHSLSDRRERGEITAFDRVIIETTGLADPAPILHTLMTDGMLSHEFRLDGVITMVDAAAGSASLDAQIEAVKQVAVADRILLTKTDLVEPAETKVLEERLRVLNPAAPIIRAHNGAVDPSSILEAGLYNPATKSLDVQSWLKAETYAEPEYHHEHHHHGAADEHAGHSHHHHDVNRHDERISAVAYTVNEPIPASLFDVWLETLMVLRGPNILRMKGIINVVGAPAPFVLHGVQHIFHPPVLLKDWPSDDRRSRIVLIGRDLTDEFLQQTFDFLGSASRRHRAHDGHDDEGHEHGQEVHA
ncbi:CobW family GTP-binding protein [Brucella intermedia]|uniref:CobW family GTP-binding protein n=1 Tax=Brucella intermedia TaxID=94625 RepID=UPI00224973ED|nr:GTP-binding protein [Brucella intermedia]